MKILVTGAHGLLGATLMETLASEGHEVLALESDIRNREEVTREVADFLPHVVIHTAALTSVALCEKEPENAHDVNVEGTKHVVYAAKASGAKLIHISTCSVFPGRTGNYVEDDTTEPSNVYDRTKIEAETHVRAYNQSLILRLNIIGIHPNGSRGKNFLEWLVDSIRDNKDLNLFMDARVNPLSNWSIASYIVRLLDEAWSEPVLHIGSRNVLSKAEIGRLVLERFPDYRGTVTEVSLDNVPDGVARPKETWLNTDRAQALLGEMPSLEEELGLIDLMGGFSV